MPTDRVCPRCREAMPAGVAECPYCAGQKRIPLLHREPVILVGVVLVTAALWVISTYLTRAYAARQQRLAEAWFQRGEAEMELGRLDRAVAELQTALTYSHDNFQYRLRLAEALAAGGHFREARAYLLALWEEEPGNGTVNLELARLSAQSNDVGDAIRYYHDAIYGLWEDDPAQRRLQARLALVNFLLDHHLVPQAQSELVAVAADLPHDPALMTRVATLMVKAGDYRRAFDLYRQVLARQPNNPDALAGAGKAAFSLQFYPEARDLLRRAAQHSEDAQIAAMFHTADLVLQSDPYLRRLSASDREQRITSAFAQAGNRLQQCAASRNVPLNAPPAANTLATDFSDWTALKPEITARNLRRNPEQGDAAMDLVFRIERDTATVCGPGNANDEALLLIAQHRESSAP